MINNTIVRRLATASILFLASTDHHSSCFVKATATATASGTEKPLISAGKLRSLAEQAMSERRFDEAVTYYSQAIDVEPSNAANYYKLFRVHSRMRNYISALTDISNACEMDPQQAEYRFQKAKLLVNLGRCDEAVEQHKIIVESGNVPKDIMSSVQAARLDALACEDEVSAAQEAFSQQDYKEAKYFFDRALSHMEHAPDLLFLKAQSQYHLGDYFGVISDTGKILKVHKQNLDAYQLRGEAYFRTGEHDVAVTHFREGLKLDPEHKGCKAGHKLVKSIMKKEKRGNDAFSAGKHEDAVEYWWQAIKIDETHRAFARPTMLKIATSYTASGDHKDAIKTVEDYLEEEESLEGILALGDAYMGGDEFDRAVNTFQKAMEFEVSVDCVD
jgi:tetratricopeptide (TPR) repeat protein